MTKETLNETFFLKVLLLSSGCYFLFGFVFCGYYQSSLSNTTCLNRYPVATWKDDQEG